MAAEIFYLWGPGENRLALMRDGRLAELVLIRPDLLSGTIMLARITETAPKMGGVFVDVGSDRPGFLSAKGLTRGAEVLVQVKSDPQGGKGAGLTQDVSLSGRYLAYSPFRPGLNVSRKLSDEKRMRLYEFLEPLVAEDEGVVLRTHAASASEEQLQDELQGLRAEWREIMEKRAAARSTPAILWQPNPLRRMLADNPGVVAVWVNDAALLAEARQMCGDGAQMLREPDYDLQDAMDAALDPVVPLPCGGRVIIEQTAALTAIDVDSGPATGVEANTQAVAVIARQLRLRNIAGQIIVDFVSGGGKGQLLKLLASLKQAVSRDAVSTHVIGMTALGLVEMTRERKGPSLADMLCNRSWGLTAEATGLEALRRLLAEAAHTPGRRWQLTVAPDVAQALSRRSDAVKQAEDRLATPLVIRSDSNRLRADYLIQEQSS